MQVWGIYLKQVGGIFLQQVGGIFQQQVGGIFLHIVTISIVLFTRLVWGLPV